MENTILHPTDFSPTSKNALEYAIVLAKTLKSKLEIVYSVDYSGKLNVEQNAVSLIAFTKQVELETHKKINEIQKYGKEKGVAYITSSHTGKRATWLPDYILKSEPIMVVMGTSGSTPISGKLFGSNTYSIIKNSNSPVLAVPESAKIKEFKRLVLSTNSGEKNVEAIQFLMKLAMPTSAIIDIVHVLNADESQDGNNQEPLNDLKARVEQVEDYNKVNYSLLKNANTAEQLRQLSKENHPDILTLFMQKQSFFKRLFKPSVTANMVHKSEVPLLVFSA
jgi:nucleotide-binding universal stress UspA family protein